MIKEAFIQPRFVGKRFEGHTLPLAVARDLAAYEDLVLELAKHLVRQKQLDRIRIPKGFANDFSLHFEKIEEGSTRPALVAIIVGAQLFPFVPAEITEAKNLINAVIATPAGHVLPADFPKELYSYFNRIGRSLKEGESIEWAPESLSNKAVLTPQKRIYLASAHRESYEAEADIVGSIEALDAKKKTGTLRIGKNDGVNFVFDDPFFADLKEALGSSTISARIKGVGMFDVNKRLTSIIEIEQLECLTHYALTSKLDALASLSDGWLEGRGIAPTSDNLNRLANEIAQYFPTNLDYPSVAPTEDGNVIFEWIRPKARIELEVNFADQSIELYATNVLSDEFVEKTFNQTKWHDAFTMVAGLIVV